jgi:hypothetical protein
MDLIVIKFLQLEQVQFHLANMAHYAFLDDQNIVKEVIVGKDEGEDGINWEEWYGNFRGQLCKRTSYNTRGGVHYDPNTNQPSADQSKAFRKNYAGIGYSYDATLDAFIPPQPFPSWILDDNTCLWEAPVPYPNDGHLYRWDEDTLSWVRVDDL